MDVRQLMSLMLQYRRSHPNTGAGFGRSSIFARPGGAVGPALAPFDAADNGAGQHVPIGQSPYSGQSPGGGGMGGGMNLMPQGGGTNLVGGAPYGDEIAAPDTGMPNVQALSALSQPPITQSPLSGPINPEADAMAMSSGKQDMLIDQLMKQRLAQASLPPPPFFFPGPGNR